MFVCWAKRVETEFVEIFGEGEVRAVGRLPDCLRRLLTSCFFYLSVYVCMFISV